MYYDGKTEQKIEQKIEQKNRAITLLCRKSNEVKVMR